MRYLTFGKNEGGPFPICFLVPTIRKDDIQKTYIDAFQLNPEEVLVLDLHHAEGKKKTPMAEMKAYLNEMVVPTLEDCKVEYLVVTDADYFKACTGAAKTEVNLGYVMDFRFGPQKVVYVPNFRSIFYDPERTRGKITQGMTALLAHRSGHYLDPGLNIIKKAYYPKDPDEIEQWLERLIQEDRELTCDVETFSLKHPTSGIGTITFCWNEHEGVAFPVDYVPIEGAVEAPFGKYVRNDRIHQALKSFFLRFKQKLIYHGIAFDGYILIYQLFMQHILDTEGLLEGLDVMLANWEDTKLITYLATNSCAGNRLGLKDQSQEFSGNYAIEEIKDITRTRLDELLQYNLIDGLSTWYVAKKHWPTLIADQQLDIYENLFKPATKDIIQMQLTGLPVNMEHVKEVRRALDLIEDNARTAILQSPIIQRFIYKLNEKWVRDKNAKLKKKRVTLADANEEFNLNSAPQLQALLFDMLGLPVMSFTDSGQPSTDGDTLKALQFKTDDQDVIDLLAALVDYKAVNKLTTSFLPAMEASTLGPDGWYYLFGNFNLGGTLSGRLSSSKPNLQNLPSNVSMVLSAAMLALLGDFIKPFVKKGKLHLGKLIKYCFEAPPGWLFCGLDFSSLEDRISALTTKDPNKLKVYTDGYDGHSLRAFAYFGEQMPLIRQSNGRRVFKVIQEGQEHYLLEGDEVKLPDGAVTTIEAVFGQ